MLAIQVHETGGPEVLQLDEVTDLTAGPGQIVVKVHAIGVNPVDTYIRSGRYPLKSPLPYTPGTDAAGTVEQVGEGVSKWQVGQRVYTSHLVKGAYAEKILCRQDDIFPLPENVSFEAGAALGVPYATAYRALVQVGGAKPGQSVMIHGASGGVGVAAIQIAKSIDLKVCGTAGTPQGVQFVEQLGVRYALNHNEDGYMSDALGVTCGRGFDIVLEMLANVNLGADLGVLAPNGRVVVIGSRGTVEVNPRDLMSRDASIHGVMLFNTPVEQVPEIHRALYTGLQSGTLQPQVGRTFPLSEAAAAHTAIMESPAMGKILLIP